MPGGGQTEAGGTYDTHAVKMENTLRQMRSLRWSVSDFHFGRVIGKGRASTVQLAVHVSTGMQFAIKKCPGAIMSVEAERVRVEEEIAVHSTIFHPAITTFYGSFTDHDGNVYLILEYAKRGDLFNLLYSARIGHYDGNDEDDFVMSEAEVCERVMGPLISAVAYLHDRDIVHRDIKPENLMLSNESKGCKLADFGFAIDTSRDCAFTRWGPQKILIPVRPSRHSRSCAFSPSDVFAFSLAAFFGVFGRKALLTYRYCCTVLFTYTAVLKWEKKNKKYTSK